MPEFILAIVAVIRVFYRTRSATALEVLALRQPVAVLKRKRPRTSALTRFTKTPSKNFRVGLEVVESHESEHPA